MTEIEQALRRVRAWIRTSGLGPWGVARRAGLSGNTLRGYRKRDWNPTAETLRAVLSLIPDDFETPSEEDDSLDDAELAESDRSLVPA